jgi:hypothetical protein
VNTAVATTKKRYDVENATETDMLTMSVQDAMATAK